MILVSVFLMISLVSANTFVIGKIYNTNYAKEVFNAAVSVICQVNTKTTTSLSDGTYAVGFELSECANKSSVSITATKDNLYGSNGGLIDNSNETDFFTVKNIIMTVQPSPPSGGGGGGGESSGTFYLCGNGVCDSGETPSLCPQDCKVINQTAEIAETEEKSFGETPAPNIPSETETSNSGFAKITGAVIGTLGTTGSLVVLIFIIMIIVLAIIIAVVRKGKAIKEKK